MALLPLASNNVAASPRDRRALDMLRPMVQLLVPLETGHELEMLLPTAPQAQVVHLDGRSFVLLGRFEDARVAYRLGRGFQGRIRLPFELAYDGAHPQIDGGWLAQEHGLSPPVEIARQASMAAAMLVEAASAGLADGSRASQLGGALMLQATATTRKAHGPMAGSATPPAHPPLAMPQEQVAASPSQPPGPDFPSLTAAPPRSRFKAEEDTQLDPRLASGQAAAGGEPLLLVGDEASEAAVPMGEPEGPVPALQTGGYEGDPDHPSRLNGDNAAVEELPLSEVLSTALRQLVPDPPSRPVAPIRRGGSAHQLSRHAEEVPLSEVVAAALQQLAPNPPIQPVATPRSPIKPVTITAVPLVSSQLLAVNASLNYLFVRLQSPEQLTALHRHAVVAEMGQRNGELLARVGVFSPTREGRRLLNQQASRLAAMGYDLEVKYVNT